MKRSVVLTCIAGGVICCLIGLSCFRKVQEPEAGEERKEEAEEDLKYMFMVIRGVPLPTTRFILASGTGYASGDDDG